MTLTNEEFNERMRTAVAEGITLRDAIAEDDELDAITPHDPTLAFMLATVRGAAHAVDAYMRGKYGPPADAPAPEPDYGIDLSAVDGEVRRG